MDLELEQGLRSLAGLIQRKVIEPGMRREQDEGEESEEMKLQQLVCALLDGLIWGSFVDFGCFFLLFCCAQCFGELPERVGSES